ncbi:MAG TPA: hypothetical protein VGS01_16835 [Candidatus Limnocylindria bacterium]|nr:hypothetical protein [Candidatus Limnocylindria bacterium]
MTVGGAWGCAQGWPYLQVTEDPAETAAYDKRGGMPHTLWSEWFSGAEIRKQIIEDYGVDIGLRVDRVQRESWWTTDLGPRPRDRGVGGSQGRPVPAYDAGTEEHAVPHDAF